jgi:putative transposase
MRTVSYGRCRIPLSFRDVEGLLSQRGIDMSYETARRWSIKFGLAYAKM